MSTVIDPRTLPDLKHINSFDDANEALLHLGKITVSLQEQEADLNAELQKLRDKYDERTIEARSAKEQLEKMLEKFVFAEKKEFREDRSRELSHGTIGLRVSPPKTEILNKKFTWKKVLDLLQDTKWGKMFIRSKPEIDKDAIIKAFLAKDLNEKKLVEVGLKIEQSENFFYQINWDTLN